jgi:hypothetical protein
LTEEHQSEKGIRFVVPLLQRFEGEGRDSLYSFGSAWNFQPSHWGERHGDARVTSSARDSRAGAADREQAFAAASRFAFHVGLGDDSGYDQLGQVTSGKKHFSDGIPVSGRQFEYSFDDIGNRKFAGFTP